MLEIVATVTSELCDCAIVIRFNYIYFTAIQCEFWYNLGK